MGWACGRVLYSGSCTVHSREAFAAVRRHGSIESLLLRGSDRFSIQSREHGGDSKLVVYKD